MRDIILLTGASGHLGSAMLRLLVEEWDVICLCRRPINLSHLPSTLHDRVISLQMDIKHLHMSQILEEISEVLHRKSTMLSGLVNNAYFISVDSPFDVSLDSCDSALKVFFLV